MSAASLYYSQNLAFGQDHYGSSAASSNTLTSDLTTAGASDLGSPGTPTDVGDVGGTNNPISTLDENQAQSNRRCSVRGCSVTISQDSANKMCETCRGRHRIYATTKRARRKLEKAAVSGQPFVRGVWTPQPQPQPQLQQQTTEDSQPPPVHQLPLQTPLPIDPDPQMATPSDSPSNIPERSAPTPSASFKPVVSWDHSAIDPRLFTSQSSELAGALTLPSTPPISHYTIQPTNGSSSVAAADNILASAPAPESQPQGSCSSHDLNESSSTSPETSASPTAAIPEPKQPGSSSSSSSSSPSTPAPVSTPSAAPRFCSVKGCRAIIPGEYFFKMCEPCRDRYRGYGTTKRAKWKRERMAFNEELDALRADEDKKRAALGLKPLSESPEELHAWETSIIDEQVPLPPGPTLDPNSPYSHPPDPAHIVLPARMCTVSHCHKILPGSYRYRRCEQHRLQNRHHSKLKRVREKRVKALGPSGNGADADGEGQDYNVRWAPGKVVGEESRGGEEEGVSEVPGDRNKNGNDSEREKLPPPGPWFTHAPMGTDCGKPRSLSATRGVRRTNHTCSIKACYNLLAPSVPWKMCDECRAHDRMVRKNKRAKARQEATAAGMAVGTGTVAGVVYGSNPGKDRRGEGMGPVMMELEFDMDEDGDSESVTTETSEDSAVDTANVSGTPNISSALTSTPQPIPLYVPTMTIGDLSTSTLDMHSQNAPSSTAATTSTPSFLTTPAGSSTGQGITTRTMIPTQSNSGESDGANQIFTDLLLPQKDKSTFVMTTSDEGAATTTINPPPQTSSTTSNIPPIETPSFVSTTPKPVPSVGEPRPRKRRATKTSKQADDESGTSPNVPATTGSNLIQVSSPAAKRKPEQVIPKQSTLPAPPLYPYMSHIQPQYHVPYYMPPPFSMPPYSMPPQLRQGASSSSPSASNGATYPPPYSYHHQPYGYVPQPPYFQPYPYMPPRYIAAPYHVPPHQQSYSAPPNVYHQPFPYAKADATFNYYRPLQLQSELPSVRRRKRKRDERAKEDSILAQVTTPASSTLTPPVTAPIPRSDQSPDSIEQSNGIDHSTIPETPRNEAESDPTTINATFEANSHPTGGSIPRPCGNKSCHRVIPAGVTGTICERCRVRIKKHQAKTKQRFRLEPRKLVVGGNLGGEETTTTTS